MLYLNMLYLFGTMFVVASFVLSLMAGVSYLLTLKLGHRALGYGRVGVYGSFVTVSALWLLLVALFLARRFDINYVFMYSSTDLNVFFTIAASWAGQQGSFALWALLNAVVAVLLLHHTRHFEPYVLGILMLLQSGLLVLLLFSNPFVPFTDPSSGMIPAQLPQEGHGLNSLLHNFWMIIHPPVLFVGYALAAVPFAFALGGLLRHDYDGWVTRALPWTLAAWVFLGLGILLGAYWAYETLGWGGYWAWDPVENSSLVPWLLLTALIHSMLVQRTHGSLRRTNIALSIVAFLTVLYATFLTRSGVLDNFSVHSYVAAGLQEALITLMVITLLGSVGLFAWRWRDIPRRPLEAAFLSKDSFLVLATIALVVVAVVVVAGTSMPVISYIPGVGHSLQNVLGSVFEINDGSAMTGQPLEDGRFSLTQSFYETTTPPLFLIAVLLLVFAPLLSWNDTHRQHVIRSMPWPFAAGVVATLIAIVVGARQPFSLLFIFVSVFAIGTNLLTIIRTYRSSKNWLFTGGQISHLGFCILVIGIIGSKVYASPDERLLVSSGETMSIYGVDITFDDWQRTEDNKGYLDLTVSKGGSEFTARPQLYFDQRMSSTMQTPSIKSYIWYDLYISPVEYAPAEDPSKPVVRQGETVQAGPYEIAFQGFTLNEDEFSETGIAEVGVELNVTYEGKESLVVPKVLIDPEEENPNPEEPFTKVPTTLPGGHTVTLSLFDPSQQMAMLEIEDMGEDVDPAHAVLTVSTKPLVILVWAGVIINVLGGMVAIARRHVEGQARLRGRPVPMPAAEASQISSLN
jgi:cytochrome c-type biogenesis protein CcmF